MISTFLQFSVLSDFLKLQAGSTSTIRNNKALHFEEKGNGKHTKQAEKPPWF